MNEVAYTQAPDENPNFVSRPPDPGFGSLAGTIGWDALYHSPFSGTYRLSQLSLEKYDFFNPDGRTLQPKEAADKYGLGGQLSFSEPIKESAAQLMMQRKIDENDRNYVISSGMNSGYRQAAGIGIGMAATLIDPINFASMFVPVVGEARFARMVTRFGGSVLKARLASGAIEGAVGAAMVEPFVLLPAMQEQANYDLNDSLANLGYGAALGGFLHAGFGAVADRFKKIEPRESDAMFEAAMNNILKDEPVLTPAKLEEFAESTTVKNESFENVKIPEQNETLGDLIGQNVEYAGYSGKLIRDEEGNFVVMKEFRQANEPWAVEIADTGKDPELRASDLQVFKPGHLNAVAEAKKQGIQILQDRINSNKAQVETNSGANKQDLKVNQETKTDISRLTEDDMKSTSETPKVLSDIQKESAEIESFLKLEDEAKASFNEKMKSEIGDQGKREVAVRTAVDCIIKNLI
jgi:hypothetical protein